MKYLPIKIALIAVIALTNPLLTFAGGQPAKMRTLGRNEAQNFAGAARAVQPGKGTGISRDQIVRPNADRVQTAKDNSIAVRANPGDSAFHK
jgi:hypothetical protein